MKYGKYRINMEKQTKACYNETTLCNLGNSTQELAMDKIFSDIDITESDCIYIARDEDFDNHNNNDFTIIPVHMSIMENNKKRLPLPDNYKPVFLAIYNRDGVFDNEPELLEYLKKFQPIGCRDEHSKNILRKYGIKAYLTGCFTVCFDVRKSTPSDGKVFIIDVPDEVNEYIPENLKVNAIYLSNVISTKIHPVTEEEDIRQKEIARKRLEMYKNEAKLMITGRLHIAIPCMAMGIPVILIRDNYDHRFGWVDKYLPLYTIEDVHDIDWSPKSVDCSFARKKITDFLRKSMLGEENAEQELVELDEYYCNRNKTILNKKICDIVTEVVKKIGHENFTYAIWGTGETGRTLHDVISEKFPEAKVVVLVDKFFEGNLYGVPIIKGEQLKEINFDHMFISTVPGRHEAIDKMNELFGGNAKEKYSIVTTFVKA